MGDEAGSFVFIMNGRPAATQKTFPALRQHIVHLLYHDAPERSASFAAVPEAALRSSSRRAATSTEIDLVSAGLIEEPVSVSLRRPLVLSPLDLARATTESGDAYRYWKISFQCKARLYRAS